MADPTVAPSTPRAAAALGRRARDLDAADPLRAFADRFVAMDGSGIVATSTATRSAARPSRPPSA
jgi:hypothetical protein